MNDSVIPNTLLNRRRLCRRLHDTVDDRDAVIGGIGNTNFDLWAAGHRPCNFYMLGSMGLAAPIAMGVALAQPQRNVIALEGDGSLLMSLGCLATIGMVRPANLTIVVFDNAMYEITGGQQSATARHADVVAIARGAGVAAHWARGDEHFVELMQSARPARGPLLIGARVDNERADVQTPRDPALIRQRFMQGLGSGRQTPLDD